MSSSPTDEVIFFRGVGLNHQPADAFKAGPNLAPKMVRSPSPTEPKKDGAKKRPVVVETLRSVLLR